MTELRLGPDAARYWLAGQGKPVARPFHLRWLLPSVCGNDPRRWWAVWAVSWPLLAGGVFVLADLGWQRSLLAAVLCVGLPGVWGPAVVRPVGVDLPAMAVAVWAAVCASHGVWWAAMLLALVAGAVKESAPLWAALWAWSWVPLLGFGWVLFAAVVIRPEIDEVTARADLREIHDHPIRSALRYRRALDQQNLPWWRNGWIMVAPWGVCLAALYAPTWQTAAVLAVAHAQLLVATDTARLLHTAAGPAVAVAAASVIPVPWLAVAAVAHWFWLTRTEAM